MSRGTVAGRPAVRLRYRLSAGSLTVIDTEYDIVAASSLAVGPAQRQTTYDVITIVIGTPVSQPNRSLVDWVASTIAIHN